MKRATVVTGLVGALAAGTVVVVATAQERIDRAPWWPRTAGAVVLTEWFSDVPWHQKLGTFAGNEIDEALILPYDALGDSNKAYCTNRQLSEEDCMLETGVNNILGMLRTDTPYDPQDPQIKAAKECQDPSLPCIEVKLELGSYSTESVDGKLELRPRVFGPEPADAAGEYPRYVISDGTSYAPQMPWYMAHYCDSQFKPRVNDVQDPVCYGDYFSPMNNGFNPMGKGAEDWPRSSPWSVYPAGSGPSNHCKEGETKCTMVMAGFDLRELPSNPNDLQYRKYNDFLLTWFNGALKSFPSDISAAENQRHFPWSGKEVGWESFLYPQAALNPFLGQFDYVETAPANAPGCDTTLTGPNLPIGPGLPKCVNTAILRGSHYLYPRQCNLADLAGANVARLRQCGLNYELHHNGFLDQWPEPFHAAVRTAGMIANQYGRTSFLFAGVPGMQMPVSLLKSPGGDSGLNMYEQVNNASIFSLYLPITNFADTRRAFNGRNYTDTEFYHTLLMSNHMEAEPRQFMEGIRGKVLWHNEYRTQKMYQDFKTNAATKFETRNFAGAFEAKNATAPFHNNTCDGCHVRNGSGIPVNPAGKLDVALQEFMKPDTYNPYPVKDYTFTGQVRPMKLVFFDLQRDTTRLDSSRFSEPLAFSSGLLASPPRNLNKEDLYYNNKIMNYYGDSFHATAPGYSYSWVYGPVSAERMVVSAARINAELGKTYQPWQVNVGSFETSAPCQIVLPAPTTKPWPGNCEEVNGAAILASLDSGAVGFMLLNGKRLGNLSAIEAIPNHAIVGFRDSQKAVLGERIAGEIIWNAGSRDGVDGKVHRVCRTQSLTDCFIGRFGWIGDRVSLEDQVANAAFVEMNMTSSEGYEKLYKSEKVAFPIRYANPNCGPADKACVESSGNGDLSEIDINRMAEYARWLGNPTRSEFKVALPEVIAGEKIFRRVKCDTCHVIRKIDIVPEDTMLNRAFRDRLATRVAQTANPFLSYLGTDLLMHDMGYLSQLARADTPIRDAEGVVLPAFQNYVQKIRTPALKGLRFNRYVTDSHLNTKKPDDPACDFLLHDGRACDAVEAAFLHDGPAVKKLGVIDGLNGLTAQVVLELRAFLYSL